MRINSLRKLIKSQLDTVCNRVYSSVADCDALYPHIVYSFPVTRKTDAMNAVTVDIEVWTKSQIEANDIVDKVEKLFDNVNLPQDDILPTFFVENIKEVPDEDKTIVHRHIELSVQNYEREELNNG